MGSPESGEKDSYLEEMAILEQSIAQKEKELRDLRAEKIRKDDEKIKSLRENDDYEELINLIEGRAELNHRIQSLWGAIENGPDRESVKERDRLYEVKKEVDSKIESASDKVPENVKKSIRLHENVLDDKYNEERRPV